MTRDLILCTPMISRDLCRVFHGVACRLPCAKRCHSCGKPALHRDAHGDLCGSCWTGVRVLVKRITKT